MPISCCPRECCSPIDYVLLIRLNVFFSQEQPHHLFISIPCSPYEGRHTRTISLIYVPSVHLYQSIGHFGDAEVRDTVQGGKRLIIGAIAEMRLSMNRFPKGFGRYVTIKLTKKLERNCCCVIRELHSHVGSPI